jgi:hypothetical protein
MSSGSDAVNMKSAKVYVMVALGATYVLELAAYFTGALDRESSSALQYLLFVIVLIIPVIAVRVSGRESSDSDARRATYWPLPWMMFWLIVLGAPGICLATNAMEAALGWTSLDLSFESVVKLMPEGSETPPASTFIILAVLVDFVVIVAVYTPIALGFEYGWRVHFGRGIESLGRLKAYAIAGVLSGACFAPLLFSDITYIAHPLIAAARVLLMIAILGGVSSEIFRLSGNATLCAIFVAAFFSQTLGTMNYLFPLHRFDWGGPFGWLSIAVWALVLAAVSRIPASRKGE